MIPRIRMLQWLYRSSEKKILVIAVSIVLILSPAGVLGDGNSKFYHNCQQNPLECTYGKGKYDAPSSPSCTDRHPNCREYALRGNCIRNSQWMEAQCPVSCGICPTTSDDNSNHQNCIDHHPNCLKWANEQECFINPPFINSACPMSCIRCVVVNNDPDESSARNSDNTNNAELQARVLYSQTDFGVWQSLPLDDLNLVPATTQVLLEMGEYAQELLEEEVERIRRMEQLPVGDRQFHPPLLGPTAVCNNMRHDCAVLVARNGGSCSSSPNNLEMMLQECSFACRFCHETYTYHQCRSSSSSGGRSSTDRISLWETSDTTTTTRMSTSKNNMNHYLWNHLSTRHGAINLAAAAATSQTIQNEWVASLNYTALWKENDAPAQRNQLLQIAMSAFADDDDATTCSSSSSNDGELQRGRRGSSGADGGSIVTCYSPTSMTTTSTATNPASTSDDRSDTTTSSTAAVSPLSSSSCQDLEHEMARMLNIPPEYLEPLEFLQYGSKRNDDGTNHYPRQVPMSEFDIHDQWKPSGHALFTALVILQPAKKGGSIGFPDLDWLVLVDNAPPEILVWPTSSSLASSTSSSSTQYPQEEELTNMKSEILPVIQGDLYAIKIRVRQYPYSYNPDCVVNTAA